MAPFPWQREPGQGLTLASSQEVRTTMSSSAASQSGFAEVNGATLHYELAGAGSPGALLHAGIADSGMWDDQFAHFAAAHQGLRFDMRGFGQPSMPDEPYSPADDLCGLLRQLGIGPAPIVVGAGAARPG